MLLLLICPHTNQATIDPKSTYAKLELTIIIETLHFCLCSITDAMRLTYFSARRRREDFPGGEVSLG